MQLLETPENILGLGGLGFFSNKISVLLSWLSESDSWQGENIQFQCKGRGVPGKGVGEAALM